MAAGDASCTYDTLVKAAEDNKPVIVKGDWLLVRVENLNPKDFYVAPLLFWANKERPLTIQILDPDDPDTIIKQWSVKIGQRHDWTRKRYKLNGDRQNGKALFRIGWPRKDAKNPTDEDFTLCAGRLTSKKLKRQRAIDAGVCPECGTKGDWIRLALCCPTHGAFG